jgi:hypothetical protein
MIMVANFKDISDAFDFVSFAPMCEHQAFLNKETGQVLWHSDLADDLDDLPENIDDEKYIVIPHKNELGLGKSLALAFARQYLPSEADEVESIFRRKGAYSRFKELLVRNGRLDQWHEFESHVQEKVLREWCKESGIQVHG